MPINLSMNPNEAEFASLGVTLSSRLFRKTVQSLNALADREGLPRLAIKEEEATPERVGAACWRPELGSVQLGLQAGTAAQDWSWVTGQMLLAAYSSGLVPEIDVEIEGRFPIAVAGRTVAGERLRIAGDRRGLVVLDAGVPRLTLTKVSVEGAHPVWVEEPEQDIIRIGSGSLATRCDGVGVKHWYPMCVVGSPASDPRRSIRTIEEAVAMLERHLPAHYLWVSLVLREVLLLENAGPETTVSQSFTAWPGHLQLSEASTVLTITMLIHECAHQYFNLLTRFGRVTTRGAPTAHSVLTGTQRPMEKILLGYHAFANILLTLRLLQDLDVGLDRRELERQVESTARKVADLDHVLERHCETSLEDLGRSIFLPLRARVRGAVELPSPNIHDAA